MKRLLLGAAVAAIAAFGGSGAFAADGTAYMAQCKANLKSEPMPQGSPVTEAMILTFCQCIVDTGDQSVIDEGLAMAKLPRDQRFQKMSSASDKYKAATGTCAKKANFPPPPPAPPAGSTGSP